MNNLVSNENIRSILMGITDKILEDINNKDLSAEQKAILNKVDSLIIDGNGLKILTDNGTYKDCNSEELNNAILNTDIVWDLFNIEKQEEKWETRANSFTKRYCLSSCICDRKIYAIGGYHVDTVILANECYDIITNKWSRKLSLTSSRYSFTCEVYNKKIYIIGGTNATRSHVARTECYDINTDTWSNKAIMTNGGRSELTSSIYQDKIYVIGGEYGSHTKANECYDISTDTWSTKLDMPTARYGLTSSIYQDKIYVLGGQYGALKNECYNISTNTWSTKANCTNTIQSISEIYKEKIYCMGGTDYGAKSYNINQCYDIATNTWSNKLVIPVGNYGMGSAIDKNKIYIICGYSTEYLNSTYVYNIKDNNYDILLPSSIQNKLDVLNKDGDGTKILADNGSYIEIPTLYRYMNDTEINAILSELSNKINGNEV